MNKQIIRLSVSKAKTFEHCRRQYYYQYILKLPKEVREHNAAGSLVHLVLETFFKAWIAAKYQGDMKALLQGCWSECSVSKEYEFALKFNLVGLAKQYVISYFKSYIDVEIKQTIPLECEPKFTLPIDISPTLGIEVIGYIDRIDKVNEKTIRVLDYKTVGKVQYLDNFQLGIYVAACMAGPYKGYDFEAAYILLKHGNKLRFMPDAGSAYLECLDKMVKVALDIESVTAGTQYNWPPHYTPLCNWCDYKLRCQNDLGGQDEW